MSNPSLHPPLAPRVSFVLVTYSSARWLPACLESVKAQTLANWELIVVDNGSTDASLEIVHSGAPAAYCISNERNEGYAAANNQGIMQARAEFICLLNADVVLAPDYVERLVAALEADPDAGGATGKLLRLDDGGEPSRLDSTGLFVGQGFFARDRGSGDVDSGQYETSGEVFGVCCAAALLRRSMLADVAPRGDIFAPRYFAFYEDLDLCWRARSHGWTFLYQPRAVARHARGGGLGAKRFFSRPPRFQQHVMRNRYRTMARNATFADLPRRLPTLAAAEIALAAYALLRAPYLLKVYGEMLFELPRLLRERRVRRRQRAYFKRDGRLRVAQIAQPRGGGVRKVVLQLCASLPKQRVAVSGLCAQPERKTSYRGDNPGEEPFEAAFSRLGVPHRTLPMVRAISPWIDVRALIGLLRFLWREPVDVLHAHSSKAGILGRVAGWLSGVPVCYSPHAFAFQMPGFAGRCYELLERLGSWFGGVIVVESEAERRQAVRARLRGAKELRVIANAIPGEAPARKSRRETIREGGLEGTIDEAAPWITMVGRLVEQKNPALLLDAAPLILQKHPAAQLLIIGDGPLHDALAARISRGGLESNVHLLGYRSDALELVAASTLFVLPSRWEGMPFILLEAMARDVPVVVSDCIDEAGLIVDGVEGRIAPRDNPDAWAETIIELLDDPPRAREMAQRGARKVAAYQNLDEMVQEFERLYYELAGLPRPTESSRDRAASRGEQRSSGLQRVD